MLLSGICSDWIALCSFFNSELGWKQEKVDDLLLPIIRKMGKRNQVSHLLDRLRSFNRLIGLSRREVRIDRGIFLLSSTHPRVQVHLASDKHTLASVCNRLSRTSADSKLHLQPRRLHQRITRMTNTRTMKPRGQLNARNLTRVAGLLVPPEGGGAGAGVEDGQLGVGLR